MNLRINWTVPVAIPGETSAPTLTSIELRSDPSLPFEEVSRIAVPGAEVTLPNLADAHYEARLRAFDGVSYGAYSSVVVSDPTAAVLVPGQVTGVTLTRE